MDTVVIRDFRFAMGIGIHAHERRGMQTVRVDLELAVDIAAAAASERIADALDYEAVCNRIRTLAAARHYPLVEVFAAAVARALECEFGVRDYDLTIGKTEVLSEAGSVGVRLRRGRLAP